MSSYFSKKVIKKEVDGFFEDPKEKEKRFDAVDTYESVETKIRNAKEWFVSKFKRAECIVGWCHQSPEKTSSYCKTHKCHKCDQRRERNKYNCADHC